MTSFSFLTCLELFISGIVSKRADAAYAPGNRGLWLKTKCLNREDSVIVGWTDPEGLVLAYYKWDGKLIYAGRFGTGMALARCRAARK